MFKCDPNSNSQCRWRLRDPKEFTKIWTEHEWKTLKNKGISYIVGIDEHNKKSVQAIRFDRSFWTENKAAEWWNKNKHIFKKTWTQSDWDKWTKRKGDRMISDSTLKKYKLKDLFDWVGIKAIDFDEQAEEFENHTFYDLKNTIFFDENIDMIEEFIKDMESKETKKLSSIVNMYMNPTTEKMEDYVLDYKDGKYIIIEPREEEQKEFELEMNEEEFINYLIEKGEGRFDAIDIADRLKEESKIASLVKISAQNDIAFDTDAHIRVWVTVDNLEYEPEIEDIKKQNISLDKKISLAKNVAIRIAHDKISDMAFQIKDYNPIKESFDRIDWAKLLESKIEE